jgi:hypothetical protein
MGTLNNHLSRKLLQESIMHDGSPGDAARTPNESPRPIKRAKFSMYPRARVEDESKSPMSPSAVNSNRNEAWREGDTSPRNSYFIPGSVFDRQGSTRPYPDSTQSSLSSNNHVFTFSPSNTTEQGDYEKEPGGSLASFMEGPSRPLPGDNLGKPISLARCNHQA